MIKRGKDIERINDIIKSEMDSVDKKFLELFSLDINKKCNILLTTWKKFDKIIVSRLFLYFFRKPV